MESRHALPAEQSLLCLADCQLDCWPACCLRYVKSRSDSQLTGSENDPSSTSECDPEQVLQNDRSKLIMPCGLIAWSYFNDTYAVRL